MTRPFSIEGSIQRSDVQLWLERLKNNPLTMNEVDLMTSDELHDLWTRLGELNGSIQHARNNIFDRETQEQRGQK